MSVVNTVNYDFAKEPLFFGKDLGLQRYDVYKYKKFYDLFQQQLSFFWRPEEVDITTDAGQFKNLSENEKTIFTNNLGFQSVLDSVQTRGIPYLLKNCSNLELEAAGNAWTLFEQIHSYSYTYIIKNIYANASEVFDGFMENKELVKRATGVTKYYDDYISSLGSSEADEKTKLYLTLISVNILEGIRFYVSFACSFAFAEQGKMEGNAKIISLILRDENCLSNDAEALTPYGWKKIEDLSEEDMVAQYNDDETVNFVKPNAIINKPYKGTLLRFYNKKRLIDMTVTPDHRIIYKDVRTDEIDECLAKDFKPCPYKHILTSGTIVSGESDISAEDRFRIAFQADGSFRTGVKEEGKVTGTRMVYFHIKKNDKQTKLEQIISDNGFRCTTTKREDGFIDYRVFVPLDVKLSKHFKDYNYDLSTKSSKWCEDFIDEIMNWDGHRRKDTNGLYYSSIEKDNVQFVQTLCNLCNYRTKTSVQQDNRKSTYSDVYRLFISPSKNFVTSQNLIIEEVEYYDDNVVCVSVDSGMFLTRQQDTIFVTGNCHLAITQNIINYLTKNKDEGFQDIIAANKDVVLKMYEDAANEEMEWAKYLFKDGSIMGLNDDILIKYMKHLTNKRMKSIGLERIFDNTQNPINWISKWTQSKSVQNAPQETELESYKISSIKHDSNEVDFNQFNL